MLTFWGKLAVCLAVLVAIVSLPGVAVAWAALIDTHALWDALWWLAVAVVLWITWGVCGLWRVLWGYLDPRS